MIVDPQKKILSRIREFARFFISYLDSLKERYQIDENTEVRIPEIYANEKIYVFQLEIDPPGLLGAYFSYPEIMSERDQAIINYFQQRGQMLLGLSTAIDSKIKILIRAAL